MSLNEVYTCCIYVITKIMESDWKSNSSIITEQYILTAILIQFRCSKVQYGKQKYTNSILKHESGLSIVVAKELDTLVAPALDNALKKELI